MCGIFGYIGKRSDGAQIVLNGLKQLEYRGYDSWGVAVVPSSDNIATNKFQRKTGKDSIYVKKRVGKIGQASVEEMPKSGLAFGHTRWATHGGVTEKNAHPHLDCTGSIAVIHNGIIENYASLKEELIKRNHRFVSETDSEVASHLIEELLKTNTFDEAVRKAFKRFEGLSALIAFSVQNDYFVAVRSGSPLVAGFSDGEQFLSSDPSALSSYTKSVYFLKDNELLVLKKDSVELRDVHSGKVLELKRMTLSVGSSLSEKGSYPHFMLKEIYEQPDIIASIAKNGKSQAIKLADKIQKSYGTYLVGCGSASYACLAGTYLFSKIAKRHINYAIGSEFNYHLDFLTKKSFVVVLSQSGETMDTLVAVKSAKGKGASIGAMVNVYGSTLYREADIPLLIGAGVEKGVASTKAFIGKLAYLVLTAYCMKGDAKTGEHVLRLAASSSRTLLSKPFITRIKKLARHLKDSKNLYVIGRGLSYPSSLEAAMKIKEITYIHAEGIAAGELKHGPLALVESGTPCIVFAPHDETYSANIAGAMEMKARGGFIIGISDIPHEIFDVFIKVADASEATIIPNVIVSQLLAYHITVLKGQDPDMPRNLAKSVTVK